MSRAQESGTGGAAASETAPQSADPRLVADGIRAMRTDSRHARSLDFLLKLAASPPQVLLLEGGSAAERKLTALYWAALLNCPRKPAPCLACPVCLRLLGGTHRDLFYLDGSLESIKIEPVRALRALIGEPPREARVRVIILAEAQSLTEAAANAMLKSLEEPNPGTLFVLSAPQRERLLPTLVSRSWALTLAWPELRNNTEGEDWGVLLAEFSRTGTGLFARTAAKGSMDAASAQAALLSAQRALAEALSDRAQSPLAVFCANLPAERQRMADEMLDQAQESLRFAVNPALVIEWMATRFFLLGGKR